MNISSIFKKFQKLPEYLNHSSHFDTISIYYVIDSNPWSFFWDGYYITNAIQAIGGNIQTTQDPWAIKNSIIHFGDRYNFFGKTDEEIVRLCQTNKVILTWFHGFPERDPQFSSMMIRLQNIHQYLAGVHISSSLYYNQFLQCGMEPSKIHIIPIGVDTTKFYQSNDKRKLMRKSLGISDKTICIGSFQKDGAGWEEGIEPKLIKGPDIFIEVIGKIRTEYPDLMVLLTGPSRGYVKRKLEDLKIPYCHHFLDDYQNIADYYAALDLYIITSREEGGPKALGESWACGIPIVSTKVGMAFDLITEGENGFLADVENISEISEKAIRILKNQEIRDQCIKNGKESARKISWDKIGERYWSELYLPLMMA